MSKTMHMTNNPFKANRFIVRHTRTHLWCVDMTALFIRGWQTLRSVSYEPYSLFHPYQRRNEPKQVYIFGRTARFCTILANAICTATERASAFHATFNNMGKSTARNLSFNDINALNLTENRQYACQLTRFRMTFVVLCSFLLHTRKRMDFLNSRHMF